MTKWRGFWLGLLALMVVIVPTSVQAQQALTIHQAAGQGNYERAQQLLNSQNNWGKRQLLNLPDARGNTALISASMGGHATVVSLFMSSYLPRENYSLFINRQNHEGDTALILAARYRHAEVVRLLVENGANVNYTNRQNQTAMGWARANRDAYIQRLLGN